MDRVQELLEFSIFHIGKFQFQVVDIFTVVIFILAARGVLWLIRKYFDRKRKERKMDAGKQYAYMQLLSYLVYVITAVLIIDNLGFDITVILAGSTALLIGIGLGIQDFFKDLVAGFVILTERTVTAGDIVEIAGVVGKVKEVGLRTTSLLTRDDIVLIVPNTKLTQDNVVNWSQNNKVTRFRIKVGVAYGSDTELVKQVLADCAKSHKEVRADPEPFVFFEDFADSALLFSIVFYSNNLYRIERTKSDIRFLIDQKFRENNVKIPFPQRDLWVRQFPDEKE